MFKVPDWDEEIPKSNKRVKSPTIKAISTVSSKILNHNLRSDLKSKKTDTQIMNGHCPEKGQSNKRKKESNSEDSFIKIAKKRKTIKENLSFQPLTTPIKKFKNESTSSQESFVPKLKKSIKNKERDVIFRKGFLIKDSLKRKRNNKDMKKIFPDRKASDTDNNKTKETEIDESVVIPKKKKFNKLNDVQTLPLNKLKISGSTSDKNLNTKNLQKPEDNSSYRKVSNDCHQEISQKTICDIHFNESDELDELILNAKKKKLKESFENEDREELLFAESQETKKKEKLKKLLDNNNRRSINITGDKLRGRMLEKLKAAQFRFLNEKLYTSSGNEAQKLFEADPRAFSTYHEGYQQQLKKWPVNPLDVIVNKINKMPNTCVIADMGCGEAALSRRVRQKVHSFDLVSSGAGVVACDMARTPLLQAAVDVVVYCLALMGTELTRYLLEANRVLKTGGQMLIAEVESRFEDVNTFVKSVERLGFKLRNLDKQHSVFVFLHFTKVNPAPVKKAKLPDLTLKPCLYKRR